MNKTIFLDAGHNDVGDIGAKSTKYGNEYLHNIKIRDLVLPELLRQGFQVECVPDDLNLRQSIDWVNERAKDIDDGLALSIHINCCGKEGAETYYFSGSQSSKDLAVKLVDEFCLHTGMAKIGARDDTTSNAGQWGLGWIRQTNCWATLIECGYITSDNDMSFIINNYQKVAEGICRGMCKIYNQNYIESGQPETKEEIKTKIIELLNKL